MPCPSSIAARASSNRAGPPGASWSACPNENVHVTAAADGRAPDNAASSSRRRAKWARYSRHDSGELAITAPAWASATGSKSRS